jgi:hypothetical protein
MNGLLELLTNKHYMVLPAFVHGIRATLEHNLNGHVMLDEEDKVMGLPLRVSEGFDQKKAASRYEEGETSSDVKEPFVNLMTINGPITRNGGACSYGSVHHRDMMMEAADNKNCIGHIFYINTPGGSAWAKNDYQQAIDYAHSKNQPVIAFVDGLCASAGMYLAALCDERYYMHPKDEIGCIGVMAAFYTEKDGSKCEYTNETYHELYDPESFDKNKEIRDIANDDNDELLIADLARLGVEFRADVLKACPNAKDEHLHGKVFAAEEVDGILMDGQKSLNEVFNRLIDLSASKGSKAGKTAQKSLFYNNQSTTIDMTNKYQNVAKACGAEELQVNEEGTFMNAQLLDQLEQNLAQQQEAIAERDQLKEQVSQLEGQLKAQKEENNKTLEDLNAEHEAAMAQKEADHTDALAKKDEEIAALKQQIAEVDEQIETLNGQMTEKQTDMEGMKASLETAQNTIAEKDQQISDLNAQITELQNGAGAEPGAGEAPANNGAGAEAKTVGVKQYVFNPELSYDENCRREKEWNKEHGIK